MFALFLKSTIFAIAKCHGLVVQLVRIPACHAGGRGFESRPDREKHLNRGAFFVLVNFIINSFLILYITLSTINLHRMKKALAVICLAMASFAVNAQESKFYLGVGVGYATKGGDVDEGHKSGLNLNLVNLGFRFSETWGMTANLSLSDHAINDTDGAIGIGVVSFGPMVSFPIGCNVSWDLKPQYALRMKGILTGDDVEAIDDINLSGNGFLFGNSLVFGNCGSGFGFSLDFDYLWGSFNEGTLSGITIDTNENYNSLKIGIGLRYNF